MWYNFGKNRSKFFWGRERVSGFSGLSGWKLVFFLVDTDLAAILDLAFYLTEPLILG